VIADDVFEGIDGVDRPSVEDVVLTALRDSIFAADREEDDLDILSLRRPPEGYATGAARRARRCRSST
jgi:hypothetical protein